MESASDHNKTSESRNKLELQTKSIIFSDEEDDEDVDVYEYSISCNFESEDETDERWPGYENGVLRNFSGHHIHSRLTDGELDEARQHNAKPNVSFQLTDFTLSMCFRERNALTSLYCLR